MKKSFTLLEIILSTLILSIVVVSALNVMNILHKKNNTTYKTTIAKIDLESTRLFLEKKIRDDKQLTHLKFKNNNLFYENTLVLKNVNFFSKSTQDKLIRIEICTKSSIEVCTDFLLK